VKTILLLAAIIALFSSVVSAQTPELTKLQSEVEQLRQLYSEGLIARLELEKAEQELTATQTRIEEMKKAEELVKKAEELAKSKPVATLVKPTLMPLNRSAAVMRSTAGSWSIGNLTAVQQFFAKTFGRPLPTSAIGQSAAHNRLGWDHHNAVDVGVHPDSNEGRALIAYLQSAGIPFLAFRAAIPGVATGPHIHIGSPSHRLS
jgi:hypothetical protein